ncbi:lipopolysaccharide biosynthesis protein, partial [Rhizobium ruizarguesonis]
FSSRPESARACFMATWFQAPPCDRKPVGLNLIVSLALCGGAAVTIFWAFALLLWQILGRPDGIETIVVQRLMPRRNGVLTF